MPVAGVRLLAHRCGMAAAPENTLAGLARARALGADGVEVDVQLSADGEPFLFHDADGARVLGRPGPAAALRWRELRGLRAFGAHPLPHLDEALAACEGWPGCELTLDLHQPDPRLAEAVARRVGVHPARGRLAVLGFWRHREVLLSARRADPRVRVSVMPEAPWNGPRAARRLGAVEVCLGWDRPWTRLAYRAASRLCDVAASARRLRAMGVAVSGGVANTPEDVAYFVAQGVDGVWTDDLAMARAALEGLQGPARGLLDSAEGTEAR